MRQVFGRYLFKERERRGDIFRESFLEGVLEVEKTRNQIETFLWGRKIF